MFPTSNDNNFMFNVDPEMGVNLKYKNPVKNDVKEIISPENKLGKTTKSKNLKNNKGTMKCNTRDITKNTPRNLPKGEINTYSKSEAIKEHKIAPKENHEKKIKELNENKKKDKKETEVKNFINKDRQSPQFIHEINTRNKTVNELLKRIISNANRHGVNLRPGQINSMDGNCLWEALV